MIGKEWKEKGDGSVVKCRKIGGVVELVGNFSVVSGFVSVDLVVGGFFVGVNFVLLL